MTKRKLLGAILLLLLPIIAWVGVAGAQSFRSGDNVTVPGNRTVNGMLWAGGRTIDIAGNVNGDVFCAGQNVTISGKVDGDVICAAQTINISGEVSGDVRLAAQTVTLGSKIAGSATVGAQSIAVEQAGSVSRDVSLAADEINLNGTVGRDAALTGDNVIITNTVGRNVKAATANLRLESQAQVGGDLTYTSHNTASIAGGAEVTGVTHRYTPPEKKDHGAFSRIGVILNLYMVVALLMVAFALVLLLPRLFHDISDTAVREPLKTFLVGLVAALLFPVLFLALVITIIGIPLALFLLLIWMVITAFGFLFFNYYIGRLVLRGQRNAIIIMLTGTLIVLIVSLIPFIGSLVILVAIWMGIGMVLLRLRGYYARPVYTMPVWEP